jgi:N-acetyl sugar amidotransferase
MTKCARCLLPGEYPGIQFNDEGVCNICTDFEKTWETPEYGKLGSRLASIIDAAKKGNGKYDCIVPLSGGKDSTYVLYMCRKGYGMNVLAVNFDNGFQSSSAKKNMELVARKLGVDFECYKPEWDVLRRLYACFLTKTGDFCAPCNVGIRATAFRIAKKYKVPLIVLGAVPHFDLSPPGSADYSMRTFKAVVKNDFGSKDLTDFLHPTFGERISARYIYLPSYVQWREGEIRETLKNELGWEGGHDHFDCEASPISNYLRKRKFGFARPTCKYSAMIRHGVITRDEAVQKVSVEEAEIPELVLKGFLQKLGVAEMDLDSQAEKSHLQYMKGWNRLLIKYKGEIRSVLKKVGLYERVVEYINR